MIEWQSPTQETEEKRKEEARKLRRTQPTEVKLRHIGDILTQKQQ